MGKFHLVSEISWNRKKKTISKNVESGNENTGE